MKQSLLLVLAITMALHLSAQKVIFPQEQQAGEATLSVHPSFGGDGEGYTLANDLLSASFTHADSKLTFDGCEAMGLLPADDLFSIRLGSGAEVPSSSMTLESVQTEELAADEAAAKGSLRLPGKSIKASYTYGNLSLTWRAVLRDGSHYLRT